MQTSNKCQCEKCNSDGPGCGHIDYKEAFESLTRVHQEYSMKYAALVNAKDCAKHGGINQYCSMCLAELAEKIAIGARGEWVKVTPLHEFWNAQSAWSQATFGADDERGPIGPLKHLAKEAAEAQEHPTDPFEYAYCLFLVFDSARRAGFTLDQLTQFCWQKLEINKQRHYPKTQDMNAAVEHERLPSPPQENTTSNSGQEK